MSTSTSGEWRRREFLTRSAVAGAAGLLGVTPRVAAEPPPETSTIRLYKFPGICLAPQYIAEELLRAEGFTEVQYLTFPEGPRGLAERIGAGALDLTQWYVVPFIAEIDQGTGVVVLGGVHTGCQKLVGTEAITTIRDLKGTAIAAPAVSPTTSYLVAMLASVGLDHRRDVRFVDHSFLDAVHLLADGKIDALMATPPFSQELRAKKIGRVVVDTATDRPWSQYFCCGVVANQEFIRKHPVATKRALRAILKADQVCALEPDRVARTMVERGFTTSYDYARQTMKEVPYGRWRQYNPEDTIRFYALRLHEAGMIKSSPQKIIAQGTDWRFFNELKKELKG
jgi:NitT/TauT family transport system substrate-binding protein